MGDFVHLHVHSNYSLREGAANVGDLAEAAAAHGMDSLALTDHDGMYGAVRFTLACNRFGIRAILGTELEWGDGYHVTLLARNAKGWANLCRLVSEMHLDERAQSLSPGKRPRSSFEAIANRSEGLIALSGCTRGEVPWFVSLGQIDEAERAAVRWLDVFGTENFAIELTNHLAHGDTLRNYRLIELASSIGIRTVATNNVHYAERTDAVMHDVLDCIRRIVALTRSTAPRENSELWLKPETEMAHLNPPESIEGARFIADRCEYQLPLGEFHFPELPPERGGADASRGESPTSMLARQCWDGVHRRYPRVTSAIANRLQMELRTIRREGFCGFFILVADIVDYAKRNLGIRCACRGSAAGSLVAYALGISDVDPIRHNLAFERFMNRHRREIPDIDVDFESARREEVLKYILDTYGDRTAMVAMMETFRARAALREVGKALGLPMTEVDFIAKTFPRISAGNISDALEALPEVAAANLQSSKLEMLFSLSSRLDGYPRHLALHPSGVILSDESLRDLMPMQRSFEGFLMSQFDKDDVEALGLAKLDVLGIRMLSSMAHTLSEIERIHGFRPDIDSAFAPRSSSGIGSPQVHRPSGDLVGRTRLPPDSFGADDSPAVDPIPSSSSLQAHRPSGDLVGRTHLPPDSSWTDDSPGSKSPSSSSSLRLCRAESRPPELSATKSGGTPPLLLDDRATFELIRDSRTLGCFQIESPGQRELLGKFQPDQFEDLIIDISLFRPGPVKSDMVRPFLERRHGFESTSYPHPSLVTVLRETNGVIVYHEQVMRVISVLTGCDMEEADKIRRELDNTFEAPDPRRGIAAHLSPGQAALRDSVIERAESRGWDRKSAEKVWYDVLQFASFGFCKAHAAAFAVPTYQSAWLKAHFPAEFYAGVLTHDPGMYPRRAILADARAHGIPILSVDVNRSWSNYRAEPLELTISGMEASEVTIRTGIRLALQDVKGISADEITSIIESRPWRNFQDFCRRAEVSRPVVEALVHCGGFDSIKGKRSRRELYWMVEEGWSSRERERKEQMTLPLDVTEQITLPGIADYSLREKVEAELEVLSLDVTCHLISFYQDHLRSLGWIPASELRTQRSNARVVVAGVKVATQTPPVKSGKRVIFLTLEDGTGQSDIALFEEAQAKYARCVFDGWILAVKGTVRRTGNRGVSILGEEVIDLAKYQLPPTKLWHSSGGSAGR